MRRGQVALVLVVLTACGSVRAATCSASASGVVFGSYTPNQVAALDSSGSVTVSCTKGALDTLPLTVSYTIALSRGSSTSYSPRQMKSGANSLNYNLYQELAAVTMWGDGSGGSARLSGILILPLVLGSASNSHTVYGRIFGAQNAVPGAYSDSITVTVSY